MTSFGLVFVVKFGGVGVGLVVLAAATHVSIVALDLIIALVNSDAVVIADAVDIADTMVVVLTTDCSDAIVVAVVVLVVVVPTIDSYAVVVLVVPTMDFDVLLSTTMPYNFVETGRTNP